MGQERSVAAKGEMCCSVWVWRCVALLGGRNPGIYVASLRGIFSWGGCWPLAGADRPVRHCVVRGAAPSNWLAGAPAQPGSDS